MSSPAEAGAQQDPAGGDPSRTGGGADQAPVPGRANPVIAIDGPSGSGKSTVARRVAQRLGLRYLDTGAMYRAVTWQVLESGLDPADPVVLAAWLTPERLDRMKVAIGTDPRRSRVTVGGVDVATAIRSAPVTAAVSAVAAVPAVRRWLVSRQRELIAGGGIVVEGRDIGTTVAPDAPVKVFLTASGEVRAARRHREEDAASEADGVARTQAQLEQRDLLDSTRSASPLVRAADSVEVDSTHLGVAAVVRAVLAHCAAAGVHPAASRPRPTPPARP